MEHKWKNNAVLFKELAQVLRSKNTIACSKKADELEANPKVLNLHFRSLELNSTDMLALSKVLQREEAKQIHSISFSYNPEIGDQGAIALAQALPSNIHEIGMVDCGIGDEGAAALLNWVNQTDALQMLCFEDNVFSKEMKEQFRTLDETRSGLMVIV